MLRESLRPPRLFRPGLNLLGVLLWLLASASLSRAWAEAAWGQFRGPGGTGVAAAARPPVRLDAGTQAWKVPVGRGLSAPVVADGRIYLTALEGERLVTLAFEAGSGRPVWRREAPAVPLERCHAVSSPATPTPFADAGRVHVYFGSYGLLTYDRDGRELWTRPIETPRTLYGMATSPIGYGDYLIIVLDNDANLPDSKLSQSRILAVEKATGKTVWESPRPLLRSGWSTPTIWTHDRGDELVVLGSGRVAGYDPRTGAEKWLVTGFSRETIAVPVAGSGFVFAASSMLGGVPDEQPDPEPFWQAMLRFDANRDGRLERGEMIEHFTMPLRPELPVEHPGFGIPLPADPTRRKERQNSLFAGVDKDRDGFWTREEFVANLAFRREKPLLVAIRPGGEGDVTSTHVAWRLHRSIPEIPSPLFHRDRLYLVRNGGILTCVDATSGKILYDQRLDDGGQYSASPVLANGHLYLVSNRGAVTVVKAGDTFEAVGRHELGEAAFVTPAIDRTAIYFRTEGSLVAFRAGE